MIKKIIASFDIIRIIAIWISFYFGYQIGFQNGDYSPEAQLHFMIPIIIIAIAGLSGIEGLFFGKYSAELKGFKSNGNYQRQSAIALLSYAIISVIVLILNWWIKAELTIYFTFIFFFFFSAINHMADTIIRKNYKWQNVNRPILTLLLIVGTIYPVIEALKRI